MLFAEDPENMKKTSYLLFLTLCNGAIYLIIIDVLPCQRPYVGLEISHMSTIFHPCSFHQSKRACSVDLFFTKTIL